MDCEGEAVRHGRTLLTWNHLWLSSIEYCISKVHGNSLDSPRTTVLYELVADQGNHLKYGITSQTNPLNRYTREFMLDKRMRIIATGTGREMYILEN